MYLVSPIYVFYGKRIGSVHKKADCLNFATIFGQQIKYDPNIILLTSVRIVCYLACTARCFIG